MTNQPLHLTAAALPVILIPPAPAAVAGELCRSLQDSDRMAMDKDEKSRLKKLGKQAVADRSRELQDRLREANPAPVGSDAWAKNYRDGTLKERALRVNPPDRLTATELAESFVPNPANQNLPVELFGIPGRFWECLVCGEVINSLPLAAVRCQCGNVTIDPENSVRLFAKSDRVRLVTLIGKGSE
jgi:hypothetical protein